jgi:multimeric flavodoxin WrbA
MIKKPKKLLIIAHTPSPNTIQMAEAILAGANHNSVENVLATLLSPFDCDSNIVLQSDALILFTTENFGYMSGALKDLFERIYYPCISDSKRSDAKPFALIIKAGLDGTGSEISVAKITTGLKWRQVQQTLLCKGQFEPNFVQQCNDLGLLIAASLEAEII